MSKIKQKYYAFRTAEKAYNKRKVNLAHAFTSELHVCAKELNKEKFVIIATEMIDTLGVQYEVTIGQIKVLYNLEW